ncbi:MAG: tRNA guanosine(15) transglycosylase TgtA [Candidatus Nezhaarchaeota archaeon]|nr:tRNA guanosine(15) transglycosylase TgtA [Candidatus Nezhaarchaeota archaeon]
MFEVKHYDLLGRVGRLHTHRNKLETPTLLPVVNPLRQVIPPRDLHEMGFEAITTNAYLLMKNLKERVEVEGLHKSLGFNGVIMTDSGAYQLLVYGKIDASPDEIVDFQVKIGSDIAVILDVPTGHPATRSRAEFTVEETLRRARRLFELERGRALWVGPVQGGAWLDLVSLCAREMANLPFDLYALGSPTKIMEQYMFDKLIDMILAAKLYLPHGKPLHLFGAGHPMMFSLAVGLGCDTFDSASYALYARQGRYMVETGTLRIEDLDHLPCSCPVCCKLTAEELRKMPKHEVEGALAKHNLYVCLAELKRVKQAIKEGRLWDLIEIRSGCHPSMTLALRKLKGLVSILEKGTPISKPRGIFFSSALSTYRPEVYRFRKRVVERYSFNKPVLLLLPPPPTTPFSRSRVIKSLLKQLFLLLDHDLGLINLCIYATPLGIVPLELDETYPASQHVSIKGLEEEVEEVSAMQVANIIGRGGFEVVIYLHYPPLKGVIYSSALRACLKKGVVFKAITPTASPWSLASVEEVASLIKAFLKERKAATPSLS